MYIGSVPGPLGPWNGISTGELIATVTSASSSDPHPAIARHKAITRGNDLPIAFLPPHSSIKFAEHRG
jgi:hypothetical protein